MSDYPGSVRWQHVLAPHTDIIQNPAPRTTSRDGDRLLLIYYIFIFQIQTILSYCNV